MDKIVEHYKCKRKLRTSLRVCIGDNLKKLDTFSEFSESYNVRFYTKVLMRCDKSNAIYHFSENRYSDKVQVFLKSIESLREHIHEDPLCEKYLYKIISLISDYKIKFRQLDIKYNR